MRSKKGYKRGYPVAILAGIEESQVVLWKVFSKVVKSVMSFQIDKDRKNRKALYNFHESIVDSLRPTLKEGLRSIIIVSPPKTNYTQEFISHVREHHTWLIQGPNKATFSQIKGSAITLSNVLALIKTPMFHKHINKTTSEEAENLVEIVEKRLNASKKENLVLFSLEEAEKLVLGSQKNGTLKPEYLLITDRYLAKKHNKNRLNRIMQIAANKNVKTRIVNAKSPAGVRLTQLGGLICLAQPK